MRCDVCGYKIMPGQHECPNCGYKWDDGRVNTFDKNAYDHEHIQNRPKSQVKNNEPKPRKTVINPKSTVEKNNIIPTLIKIFVGLCIAGLLFSALVGVASNISYLFDDISETLFQDEDTYTESYAETTIEDEDIKQREEDIVAFFEGLGLTDIDTYEYVGTGSYVSFSVYAYDEDNTMYEIEETYMNNALYETTFVLSGYLDSSIQSGDLTINKDLIDAIDDYTECGNLYDMINVYRSHMSIDDDGSYLYYDNDIYFTEEYQDYYGNYYYYFSIDF